MSLTLQIQGNPSPTRAWKGDSPSSFSSVTRQMFTSWQLTKRQLLVKDSLVNKSGSIRTAASAYPFLPLAGFNMRFCSFSSFWRQNSIPAHQFELLPLFPLACNTFSDSPPGIWACRVSGSIWPLWPKLSFLPSKGKAPCLCFSVIWGIRHSWWKWFFWTFILPFRRAPFLIPIITHASRQEASLTTETLGSSFYVIAVPDCLQFNIFVQFPLLLWENSNT